ncbi:hypothetical protein [Methylacidimicrobium sp. AP8]|uniref:hypothetical protein n=1 Tax=Methylacidimicrobium sp. AP8 TaxID=2730359 RepID=UPI001920735B|nr:hypothetical protein [Methylacidimicrobium sp. AP8]
MRPDRPPGGAGRRGRFVRPQERPGRTRPSLLWIRCRLPREILRAADLLLRDGSFPLVWIDLGRLPLPDLRRIPSTTWHRFGRLTETKGTAALLSTPVPAIPAARERYRIESSLSLACLEEPRESLWQRLRLIPLRLSGAANPESPARPATAAG